MPNIEQEKPVTKFRFKPQLSGLRFCAVLFVVVYHFSVFLIGLKNWRYDLGSFIVFFFVLSSYLITRILLDAKQKAFDKGMPVWKVAVAFLTRRTLRIFPACYLYLFILMLFPLEGQDLRQHPAMYFGYLYNVWIFITHNWGPYAVHLWTLAVEEQFYIIWPWIILFYSEPSPGESFWTHGIVRHRIPDHYADGCTTGSPVPHAGADTGLP